MSLDYLPPVRRRAENLLIAAQVVMEDRDKYNSISPVEDMLLSGPQDFLYEIHKKVKRAQALVKDPIKFNEELRDSVLDMINYAAYFGAIVELDAESTGYKEQLGKGEKT